MFKVQAITSSANYIHLLQFGNGRLSGFLYQRSMRDSREAQFFIQQMHSIVAGPAFAFLHPSRPGKPLAFHVAHDDIMLAHAGV